MAKNRLRSILDALSPDGTSVDFTEFDTNVSKLKSALKEKIQAKTLEDVNNQLDAFKKRIDFTPLTDSLSTIEASVNEKIQNITDVVDKRGAEVNTALQTGTGNTTVLTASLRDLRADLENLKTRASEIAVIRQRIDALPDAQALVSNALTSIHAAMDADEKEDDSERQRLVDDYTAQVETLRKELTNRINNFPHGGQANRNIAVNGNSSVLSKYGDINLKAGTNITLAAAANNTTKQTDITITASGSGGGGSIGGAIIGGSNEAVLFVHPASLLAQDVTNFNYNSSVAQLTLGLSGAPFDNDQRVRLAVIGNINDYADIGVQNQNAGDSATTDIFTSADNDNSTLIGHYTDLGILSSAWAPVAAGNIKIVSVAVAGSGYSVNDVLSISSGGDGNGQVTVSTVNGGGGVTGVTLTNNGTGYSTGAGFSTTGGLGSGCTITVLSIIDYTAWAPNDGYSYNSGGNYILSTDTLNKEVVVTTGGFGTANRIARFSSSSVLQLGTMGSVAGQVKFLGKTAGATVLQVPSTAGAYTFVLPPTAGNNGQILSTDGAGITTWANAGGTGITRVVSVLSVSSVIAAAAKTDYVMLPNVGVALTLPTAIGNSNLYTVKNPASSTLVATSLGETIDGSASALIAIPNQSLDFISNGSVWAII